MIFSCKKGLLFFTKIVIVLLTVQEISGIDQKISFFVQDDCNGKNTSFGDPPVSFSPEVKMSKSFLVEYGSWRVYETGTATQNENKDSNSTTGRNEKDDKPKPNIWNATAEYKICRSKSMSLEKIERIGDRDLELDTLMLYSELDFMGAPTAVNESKSFENGINFKSLAITGAKGWTTYKEKDFQGESTCFEASSVQYGVSMFNGEQKGPFFSIQKGCGNGSCSLKALFKLLFLSAIVHVLLRFI